MFKTAAAVEAVLGLNLVGASGLYTVLWAVARAGTAADAGLCDLVALGRLGAWTRTKGISLTKNGAHSQIKVFYRSLVNTENLADFTRFTGIYIG